MFRLFRRDDENNANKLVDESEPNTLSWTSDDGPTDADDEYEEDEGTDAEDEKAEVEEQAARKKKDLDLDAELAREAEEYGLTGANSVEAYGPHGEDVASVIDDLPTIDDDTANEIADAYEAVPEAERKVAQSVVRRMQRARDFESELWAAEHAVSDWLAALMLDEDGQTLYAIVADAATDAVDALILQDELAEVDFDTLYGPWSEVMDVDEEEEDEEADEDGDAESRADEGEGAEAAEAAEGAGGAEASEPAEDEGEFGPNTDLVEQLFDRLNRITGAEVSALVLAWRGQPKEDLRLAHRNLQKLADEDASWKGQLQKAQDEVLAWINGNSTRAASTSVPVAPAGPREVAGPAIADAVAALVMADVLESEDARTLYAPWAEVIKEPALPEYEEDDSAEDTAENKTEAG
jgi:hypothetical protein